MAEERTPDLEAKEFLDAYRTQPAGPAADTLPVVAWTVRGLTGGVNLLAAEVKAGRKLPESWAAICRQLGEDLIGIAGESLG
jgi:hypothetical protein